jgi:hypothetical protein
MGFRCSLLGHDYGASEVDRDREERGDEVVVTVHEFKTCDRCGTTKTVSENKEVTSIAADEEVPGGSTPGDAVLIDAGDEDATDTNASDEPAPGTESDEPAPDTAEPQEAGDPAATADESSAVDSSDDDSTAEDAEPAAADAAVDEAATDVAGDPPRDDAVILDDEDDSPDDREYGEWPAHEPGDSRPSGADPAEWPDAPGEDEGHAAAPPDDTTDPEIAGDDGELVPGASAYPDEDAQVLTDDASGGTTAEQVAGDQGSVGSGITSAGSVPSPDTASRGNANAPLVCPECEMTARSRDSLRQGDICPECKRGYLTEREHNR